MEKGFYLYAIRERKNSFLPSSLRGIDNIGQILVYPYQDIEAILSQVSIQEYDSEEIQKKSGEDINWIKEKALIHESVIEEAMGGKDGNISIIPMTFGTIFKNEKNLQALLNYNYPYFKKNLEKLKGKREWGIKFYLEDNEKIEHIVKEKDEEIKAKEREIASLPEGIAFFMEEELKEVIAWGVKREIAHYADLLCKDLTQYSVSIKKGKLLDKELTGKKEPMVLNILLLVEDKNVGRFKNEIAEISQTWSERGFYMECNGPFPVYNFLIEGECNNE